MFPYFLHVGIRCISKRSFAGVGPQEPYRGFNISTLGAGRQPEGFQGVCGFGYKSPPLSMSVLTLLYRLSKTNTGGMAAQTLGERDDYGNKFGDLGIPSFIPFFT